ncbi:DUF5675 family protein [Cochleicola gelatinilyticus]|uniref:DUF5675 domain-containing protein n=1 Tax=Cochleicola gelatinilyticus TaxID=1763537 RepID=A0A167IKS4_9FLAO|nr:DUF5675 family protein [Cochleicola gelatinilyticus]OAB79753.1 hypothetical protein ULVI_03130 [Cochleicola gelatinilyticus]
MKTVQIYRTWHDKSEPTSKQTLGFMTVQDEFGRPLFAGICMERGWVDNKKMVSCIPVGLYEIRLEKSPRFNRLLWEVYGVENRSECKFHAANYWFQLNGCIAPGQLLKDINKDGYYDVTNSRNTLNNFHAAMGNDTRAILHISNK